MSISATANQTAPVQLTPFARWTQDTNTYALAALIEWPTGSHFSLDYAGLAAPVTRVRYHRSRIKHDAAMAPSLSPDGRMVTFSAAHNMGQAGGSDSGAGEIYVKLLPNGESVQLTNDPLEIRACSHR